MIEKYRTQLAFLVMALLLIIVGVAQSWSVSIGIFNLCIVSAIMAMGVNLQWGYAGLFNAGVMGFTALGGLVAVLISHQPIYEAWSIAGTGMLISLLIVIAASISIFYISKYVNSVFKKRFLIVFVILLAAIGLGNFYGPSVDLIEDINPAKTGFLGGLGMPIIFSWVAAAFAAAFLAWIIGTVTLGLRSDYLAIATLGISEIVIAVLKHEEWLSRGVKNVTGLPRPVPYEIRLQESEWFINFIEWLNSSKLSAIETVSSKQDLLNKLVIEGSSIYVKLCYAGLFIVVLAVLFFLSQLALNSPWGRMLRAIRDNEVAAGAMGKNIVGQHLQVFILGSAIIGIAGAMLTTLDGQFTPGTYQPLRFTFIIWVMVIVGGSGNNLGSIFGGFFIWFMWIEAEPISIAFISLVTSGLDYGNPIKMHLIASAPHMRLFIMGAILLITLRFMPRGVIPEKVVRPR